MVLPKSMRIKGYRCFDHLHKSGVRYHSSLMLLRVVKAKQSLLNIQSSKLDSEVCRCAVTISNKVSKKAVLRNRIRRLIHEHLRLRLSAGTEHSNLWVLLSLKPASSNKEPAKLLQECDRLLRNAGLIQ